MARKPRVCQVCGANCKSKKVWEQHTRWGVICMACGPAWHFDASGNPKQVKR
jgi:hypothetical protein